MMLIREEFVDLDQNAIFGSSDPHEPYTDHTGALFRDLQREYGRCTGHVYIDTKSRGTLAIGWVFVSRQKYGDSNDTYLREVWVTLFDECEEDDPEHLTLTRGEHESPSGMKYHVLKAA